MEPDEARAARIQRYKDERRKQLTAKSATLFSANVTDRRGRRKPERPLSEDIDAYASSELSSSASTALPIRTTKTSRLRAAAHDASPSPRRAARSSSIPCLVEPRCRLVERDKRRSRDEKENLGGPSPGSSKAKHSIRSDEKDKASPKGVSDPSEAKREPKRRREKVLLESFNAESNVVICEAKVKAEDGALVPKAGADGGPVSEPGVFAAACVRKVERFSELLSNLCSPSEADLLFEDVLAENGLGGGSDTRLAGPACVAPCRRSQPGPGDPPRPPRAPVAPVLGDSGGSVTKSKPRTAVSPRPKTEIAQSSSRASPKTSVSPSHRERRLSSEPGAKPSLIPLAKKSVDNLSKSPAKPDLARDSRTIDRKSQSPKERVHKKTYKPKLDTGLNSNERRQRAQKDDSSDKYQILKKRLTSLEKKSLKHAKDAKEHSSNSVLSENFVGEPKLNTDLANCCTDNMSTLHDVRPHAGNSRLSQEMDSLAALTKRTLDRVNKLSNNITSAKIQTDRADPLDALFASSSEQKDYSYSYNNGLKDKPFQPRGVAERLNDIDIAAQRLIDFEKQSAMFSDLNNDSSSQSRRVDSLACSTPVSILKRKSINEDITLPHTSNGAIASPPVTFSPAVVESECSRKNRQRQGILKKRRSLDESQVALRRSCSPEVSFVVDDSADVNKPILKNRRSSLEDVVRNNSPDTIHGILKRKMSKEEDHPPEEASAGSPEPHGILKRKSTSSSCSSTASSHVSIAQAVLLAAAGGAELVDEDKDAVRPILKKKSFSEERPCPEVAACDTPRPILKKKSLEHDEYDYELPKRPILKSSKKLSGDEGNASSFDLSEDDRSSRRPSLLRSRTSDHSGSECEATVRPILKQRGSSLTRERSQSPRPRLSFCGDGEALPPPAASSGAPTAVAGPSRPSAEVASNFPSAVLRRRNQRPKSDPRSKSLVGDVNNELLSVLENRRLKVDSELRGGESGGDSPTFPSIAARIWSMEQALVGSPTDQSPRGRRDRERYKTQPVTVEEMRSIASSLEPGQARLRAFGPIASSFPSRPAESGAPENPKGPSDAAIASPFGDYGAEESPYSNLRFSYSPPGGADKDAYGQANFDSFNVATLERRQSTLEEIEKEVDKVRIALDEESRALDEDFRQAEADTWSLNVSCDSGVYNRASSRDSGPHSGEELGLIECQEIKESRAANGWSPEPMDPRDLDDSDEEEEQGAFALGLVKSNSVVARASMWQQLQQQAKGTPKPLLRHRTKARDALADRFKTQPVAANQEPEMLPLAQTASSANALDRDEDAQLDENDPAKLSIMEKMKMFNSRLTHKPPVAGQRGARLRTMPVLASHVQEALDSRLAKEALDSRLTRSFAADAPRNPDFEKKMELFRSASAKNTSLQFIMRQNRAKYRSLELEDSPPEDEGPGVRVAKPACAGLPPKPKTLAKGESSEGLKDEGIDSSSDDDSSSSVSSSESSSSSDSSEDIQPKRRLQTRKNKLKPSMTESDLARIKPEVIRPQPEVKRLPEVIKPQPEVIRPQSEVIKTQPEVIRPQPDVIRPQPDVVRVVKPDPRKIQLPGANELKERLNQVKNPDVKIPMLGKLRRPEPTRREDRSSFVRTAEPIQLGKLRRPPERLAPKVEPSPSAPQLKISALNQEAKNKFFGVPAPPRPEKSMEELAAAVRKYIPPSKSMSTHALEPPGSGSDGESSGGREVRHITTRGRHRVGGAVQRSATQADMPHKGGTIAERLAALQAAGANDWRARVCRFSPDTDDTKAIERAKNQINESLNSIDEKKHVDLDDTELGPNILADRRTKLETAAQGWRKRVPQTDATQFTVAGRLERDKGGTPPPTPPPAPAPATPATPAAPAVPTPNKFRSRKLPTSPTNGFASAPLRSASCAVIGPDPPRDPTREPTRPDREPTRPDREAIRSDREAFKRSHSVSESISRVDEADESPGAERHGVPVRVPRADDETFHAFFAPVSSGEGVAKAWRGGGEADVDLDAIDSGSRQLLSSDWSRRAKRERRHCASRNPLRALAARTDLREEYSPPPATRLRETLVRERATANCGLAAEALAALASKEDFASVALRPAAAAVVSARALMLLQVKGRRRVQTRLVEPTHTSINRGDCFVLVAPEQVFVYQGLYANVIERSRSNDIALHIQTTKDLGCKGCSSVITIDEQAKTHNHRHWHQFWTLLGVKDNVDAFRPAEAGHPDEDEIYETSMVQTNMCYEVTDDELIPFKDYWGQMPKIEMLNQSKVIVFDFGAELYIWYGKNVPLESRRRAAQLAQELFDDGYNYEDCNINPLNAALSQGARVDNAAAEKSAKSRPDWALLSKITQHMETILFKEKFQDWPDYTRVIKVKNQESKSASIEIKPCDADEMYSKEYQEPDLVLEGTHVGRGTHYYDKETMRHFDIKTRSVAKWVVRESDSVRIENDSEIGEFFSADSYIIRWEYQVVAAGRELTGKPSKHTTTGRDRCAYFCWQGKDASPNEKGTAALLTVELDKEKGPQTRVAQGSEPPAFLNLFQGNLAIHQGRRGADQARYRLFVIRGNLTNEAYLTQVPCSVRQLRSRGSLLLVDAERGCLYIWHGARSQKHTKNIAIELANKLIARKSTYLFGSNADVKITEVKEGEEPKEVFDALGCSRQYYSSVLAGGRASGGDVTPRLFHFTDLGGQFEAHEVLSPLRHEHLVTPFPFEQKELYGASQPALFLLDDGRGVWLWQGWWPRGEDGELEPAERNAGVGAFAARWQALRAAALRSAAACAARGGARPAVAVVAAGLEPRAFTDLFDVWEECDEAAAANIAHGFKAGDTMSGLAELSRLTSRDAVLPLAALQRRPPPEHVDAARLERHLATPEFEEAFGMSKDEFAELPAWKQTNMKKEIGLF